MLTKVGLPRSMPCFYGSLKCAITFAFFGTTVSEKTAANEGIGYLPISAGSPMQMGLAFAGLVVVGAMAMAMYELFAVIEQRTTRWAHRAGPTAVRTINEAPSMNQPMTHSTTHRSTHRPTHPMTYRTTHRPAHP